jgi:SAM-dependent methyltransferase
MPTTGVEPDAYAALAEVYDDWQERYGPFWKVVLPRLLDTLERHGLPGERPSFADLGCGTGSLLLALRHRRPDWALTGVEASAAMLQAAGRKVGAGAVRWVHGSFTGRWTEQLHAAAGSFFDAVNHAAAPGALTDLCAATARALAPDALFVFDVNNRRGFEAWWQGRRRYEGAGWTMTMDAHFDAAAGLAQGSALIERRGQTTLTAVTERCFTDAEVDAALAGAGFTVLESAPWRPLPDDVPGKTWWVARRR